MHRIIGFLAFLCFAFPAAAQDNWYLMAGAGGSLVNEKGVEDFNVDQPLPLGLKNLTFDGSNGSQWSYLVEGGFGRRFNNLPGGALLLGLATNYRGGYDTDPSFQYSDTVDIGRGVMKTLELSGNTDGDLSSLGFMFDMTYLATTYSYQGNGWSLYPLVNVQVGAARNSLDDLKLGLSGKFTVDYGQGESQSFNGQADCQGGDTSNVDLAYAARIGGEAAIGETMRIQVKGGWFDQGVFKTPDNFGCSASVDGDQFNFNKSVQSYEQSLNGWDVMAVLRMDL